MAEKSPPALVQLIALGSAKEAIKEYEAAADLYSQAAELQAQLNGDMAIENADVLYAYGRCLYRLGVRKSDVLGSKVSGPNTADTSKGSSSKQSEALVEESRNISTVGSVIKDKTDHSNSNNSNNSRNDQEHSNTQPYFQFKGDEAFAGSDSSDSEEDPEDTPALDEDDDFANAFEILDLARVLYLQKTAKLAADASSDAEDIRFTKERLADTYDIQAEILLEGEKFSDAATDLKASLQLKQELFPLDDPAMAECHYKLSLALEFSSVLGEDSEGRDGDTDGRGRIDYALRKDAATHMEVAIQSCKVRIARDQQKIATSVTNNGGDVAKVKRSVEEVKDIVSDMEQRLLELRRQPISIQTSEKDADATLYGNTVNQIVDKIDPDKLYKLEQVSKGANDLSALVRKKKHYSKDKDTSSSNPGTLLGNTKRTLDISTDKKPNKKIKD